MTAPLNTRRNPGKTTSFYSTAGYRRLRQTTSNSRSQTHQVARMTTFYRKEVVASQARPATRPELVDSSAFGRSATLVALTRQQNTRH